MSDQELIALATRYFDAVAAGDVDEVRACLAPGATLWVNVGGELGVEEIAGIVGVISAQVPDFRYEDAVRTATATGFIEEHHARGTAPDGSSFSYPACCIATVADGRITRINEYLDGAQLATVGLDVGEPAEA